MVSQNISANIVHYSNLPQHKKKLIFFSCFTRIFKSNIFRLNIISEFQILLRLQENVNYRPYNYNFMKHILYMLRRKPGKLFGK